jgi:hypothetical protein
MEGTYTLNSDNFVVSARNGSSAALISIIGVRDDTTGVPTDANYAYLDDRPYFDAATNTKQFKLGSYVCVRNCRFLGNHSDGALCVSVSAIVENCKCNNNKNSSTSYEGLSVNTNCLVLNCDLAAVGGVAGASLATYGRFVNCYFHDSSIGLAPGSAGGVAINCVFDTCTTHGISIGAYTNVTLFGNVFYDCAIGVYATTAPGLLAVNNVWDKCADDGNDVSYTTASKDIWFDYNHWEEVDPQMVTKGDHDLTGDPGLNAPATGDFSLANSSSGPTNTGIKLTANEGVTGTYKANMGVDQDDNSAGGGGGQKVVGGGVVK